MRKIIPLVFFLILSIKTYSGKYHTSQKDTIGSKQAQADFYLKKLQEEYKKGAYEAHKIYSDSLFVFAKENQLVKFQILGMVNQAVYFNNQGEQDKSILLYRNALSLTDLIPKDYRTKIIILVNLGNLYTKIKSYEKAISTMENVLSMLDTFEENPKIRAAALNGLANNYERLGDDEKSLEYHLKSKELGERIENESIVLTALSNISDSYQKQGNYEKAIETSKSALDLPSSKNQTKERAWLLINLGVSEQKLGNTTQSIKYLEDAKNLAASKGLLEIEIDCYKHLAEIYTVNNDNSRANKATEKYLTLKNKLLENRQSATKLDLEKDISLQKNIIKTNESKIESLLKAENRLLLWIGLFASFLIIVSILFYVFRKRSLKEEELLRRQFLSLKANFESKNKTPINPLDGFQKSKIAVYKNSSLSKEDFTNYKQQLLNLMNIEKLYLNSELSQLDLANQIGLSSNHLSELLNKGFGQNFYNFINSYRVLEAQKLMENDGNRDSKILAFGFDSGFKSKTSFNRVFKAHTGMTPSDYKKKLSS
ncbi:AraC family transcriptional regulator [Maribacter aestuarii]|uniref:AraC family transcriptional regulator n=1 Tax=Maribacter aestuarii TaxID=1130723 RepID=UPI0025A5136B|nr:AraC family transcriptional regulator [Maribacter aestuarii]